MCCDLSFPWNEPKKTITFLAYLLLTRKVKASTANCQLSAVRMAHLELGLDSPILRDPVVKLLLKGTEHWEKVSADFSEKVTRTPVIWETMLAIKRITFEVNWPLWQKDLFLAVCCLLWSGSLRVHEALSRCLDSYDPQTTLLGRDVRLTTVRAGRSEREIIQITIKSPKEDRVGNGTTLEIFGNGTFLCPIKAMKHYIFCFNSLFPSDVYRYGYRCTPPREGGIRYEIDIRVTGVALHVLGLIVAQGYK